MGIKLAIWQKKLIGVKGNELFQVVRVYNQELTKKGYLPEFLIFKVAILVFNCPYVAVLNICESKKGFH